LGGTAVADFDLLAVDRLDGALPAGQRFLQIYVYGRPDVVAVALEEFVWFLGNS
jgi:hypothetical protein